MEQAAKRLNLKGHMTGLQSGSRKFLYACCDIEGHRGLDGRYYVLDFARVFPPAHSADVQRTFLYYLLRPEFVKSWQTPLSSDAFSQFGGQDNSLEGHDAEVREASEALLTHTIPEFASALLLLSQSDISDPQYRLTELLHRAGINARYLGVVRSHLSSETAAGRDWRRWLMQEMVARVIKNELRERMRQVLGIARSNIYGEDQLKKELVRYFNRVVCKQDEESAVGHLLMVCHALTICSRCFGSRSFPRF
jgi:hypothetical protein